MEDNLTLELAKLKENPFKLVPGQKVTIWAGYDEVLKELLEVVDSPRSDRVGLYEFAIVYGELGTGKSHALRYLTYVISEHRKDEFRSPVVYLPGLKLEAKTYFISIYKATIDALVDELRHVGTELDKAMNRIVTQEWKEKESELGSVMKEAQFRENRREQLESTLCPTFPPLCRLLLHLKEDDPIARSILMGNKHSTGDLAKYRLTNSIDTSYDAIRCLGQLINLVTNPIFSESGPIYKAVYLFLDEFEVLQDFKPDQIVDINEGIRDLLNASPEHFCFLLGFTGEAATLEAFMTEMVLSRLSRPFIEIPPLEPIQAVDFLSQVLVKYRTDDSVPPEYPFTKPALEEIVSKTTQRTARNLFKNCRIVLQRSVLDGKLKKGGQIDVDLAEEYLE